MKRAIYKNRFAFGMGIAYTERVRRVAGESETKEQRKERK